VRCPVRPARKVIRRMPIQLRVVKEQLDALLVAFRGKHPDHVFAVRRPRHNVPIRQARIEHRKSVMMLRSDGDVFHASGLRQCHPRRRIKLYRIEKRRHFRVIRSMDRPRLHDPFPIAQHAVHPPVNEHPKPGILEPCARLQVRRCGRVFLLRGCRWSCRKGSCE
jgi:hypothetical protein